MESTLETMQIATDMDEDSDVDMGKSSSGSNSESFINTYPPIAQPLISQPSIIPYAPQSEHPYSISDLSETRQKSYPSPGSSGSSDDDKNPYGGVQQQPAYPQSPGTALAELESIIYGSEPGGGSLVIRGSTPSDETSIEFPFGNPFMMGNLVYCHF